MTTGPIHDALQLFRSGDELSSSSLAEPFLDALISEEDEPVLAEIFRTWNQKGITENEIYFIAKIMRERCRKVNSKHETFVDIVGTGGSRVKTFNVSTATAFVVAGHGVPVAKHGNKAATSNSGSADVLSALGIEPAVDASTAERCLNEIGLCFMYAPNFHRLSPTLGRVRCGLGFPTIFNCVGPVCNPASAPHQLIGVWDRSLVPKMANALARLGTKKSWIVHGEDGSDEISISGRTFVAEVENGRVNTFELTPDDFGLDTASLNGLVVRNPEESAAIILGVLNSDLNDRPAEKLVLVNAAAAVYLSGSKPDIMHSVAAVTAVIRGGNGIKKLGALAKAVSS
ncbi:MAG: anthranilate phosphoribosyltransferase [Candidatus Binatia bacterium]